MKLKIHFIILSVVFCSSILLSQNTGEIKKKNDKGFNISLGYSIKYHLTNTPKESNNYYDNIHAFNLCLGYKSGENTYGLETFGFPYTFNNDGSSPRYFTWIFSPYYQRSFLIDENISLTLGTFLALFSNDPKNILTIGISPGINYKINQYEIFLKNNFRFSPGFMLGYDTPWFLTFGLNIQL